MKKLLFLVFGFISFISYSQTIISDTILVNKTKVSIVTMEGEILQMNLADQVELVDEPLYLNGKSIINFKASEIFSKIAEVNIISSTGKYFSVKLKYSTEDFSPYFFLGGKRTGQQTNSMENTSTFSNNENAEDNIEQINTDTSYKDDARRINSMRDKMYSKTKYVINGFKIEFVSAYARQDKLFLRFEFENNTPYPFDSDEILFKITQQNSFNKKSSPEEIVNPIYQFEENFINIKPNQKIYKTFVFNAFKISNDRIFKISVLEKNSAIEYYLPIIAKLVNQPKALSFNDKNNSNESKEKRSKEVSQKDN